MKKFTAILLSLVLVLSLSVGLGEEESSFQPYEAKLTSILAESDPSTIIESDVHRSIMTVTLWLDLGLNDATKDFISDNIGELFMNDSYVSSDGSTRILVVGYVGTRLLSIFYDPATQKAEYSLRETGLKSSQMAEMVKTSSEFYPKSYRNSTENLLTVAQSIREVLSENK